MRFTDTALKNPVRYDHIFYMIALTNGFLQRFLMETENVVKTPDAKEMQSELELVRDLNNQFLSKFNSLLKICGAMVQYPVPKSLRSDIESLLQLVKRLQESNTYENYILVVADIIEQLAQLKVVASKDITASANSSEANEQMSTLSMSVEEEKDFDYDHNIESKNQEVDEFNVLDDSLTFCNRVIDRFESRLFGFGEKSIEQQVEELIYKARSRERLAVMYEGWMPWI